MSHELTRFFDPPPHPGEILREDVLPALGLSRAVLARRMRVAPRRLSAILAERAPVTAEIAIKLAQAIGQGPRYWLGLQVQHDLWMTTHGLWDAEAWR